VTAGCRAMEPLRAGCAGNPAKRKNGQRLRFGQYAVTSVVGRPSSALAGDRRSGAAERTRLAGSSARGALRADLEARERSPPSALSNFPPTSRTAPRSASQPSFAMISETGEGVLNTPASRVAGAGVKGPPGLGPEHV